MTQPGVESEGQLVSTGTVPPSPWGVQRTGFMRADLGGKTAEAAHIKAWNEAREMDA
ncbi:MAG: hypothetical protein ACLQPD_03400 [Desulfomonilaceae bacterium]